MNYSNNANRIVIKKENAAGLFKAQLSRSQFLQFDINENGQNDIDSLELKIINIADEQMLPNKDEVAVFALIVKELQENILFAVLNRFTKSFTCERSLEQSIYITEVFTELDLQVIVFKTAHATCMEIQNILSELSLEHKFDYFIKKGLLPSLLKPGLLVMDMDSTAIEIECIDEIAKLYGVGQAVSEVTHKAMQGELDFSESLRARVAKLKGANVSILEKVKEGLPLMPGLEKLIAYLKKNHWKVVIASGGFTFFAEYLQEKLGLYATYANELQIKEGILTGAVNGQIVDAQFKADILQKIASKLDLPASQTVAIGDGANDLPMLKTAALGVAYHAKPSVQAACEHHINYSDLRVLYIILLLSTQWAKQ